MHIPLVIRTTQPKFVFINFIPQFVISSLSLRPNIKTCKNDTKSTFIAIQLVHTARLNYFQHSSENKNKKKIEKKTERCKLCVFIVS